MHSLKTKDKQKNRERLWRQRPITGIRSGCVLYALVAAASALEALSPLDMANTRTRIESAQFVVAVVITPPELFKHPQSI